VAADARTIAAQVLRVGAIVGVPDRDCLQRSLLLYREMAAAGLTPELVVGFRKHSGSIAGHAWVRCEGIVLTEPPDELSEFDTALVFGARGELT
jgi:hypothetical protein